MTNFVHHKEHSFHFTIIYVCIELFGWTKAFKTWLNEWNGSGSGGNLIINIVNKTSRQHQWRGLTCFFYTTAVAFVSLGSKQLNARCRQKKCLQTIKCHNAFSIWGLKHFIIWSNCVSLGVNVKVRGNITRFYWIILTNVSFMKVREFSLCKLIPKSN